VEDKEIKMINHKTFTCAIPCFESKGMGNDETTDPTQERIGTPPPRTMKRFSSCV
jgi:hypothetical protein